MFVIKMSDKKPPDKKKFKGDERVIKTTLNSLVRCDSDLKENFGKSFTKKKFVAHLLEYVRTFSQSVHKGSILFNIFLLKSLKENSANFEHLDANHISDTFHSVGICDIKKNTFVTDLWNTYFKKHPFKKNDPQAISAQVFSNYGKIYDTNFHNSLWMNYRKRQSLYIKTWLKENKLEYLVYFVQAKINNWPYTPRDEEQAKKEKKLDKKLINFIEEQRKELGITDGTCVSEVWLKHKERKIVLVKYYYKILSYLEQFDDVKLFTLAPITKITNIYMPIDSWTLYHILQHFLEENNILQTDTKISKIVYKTVKENEAALWNYVFDVDKIEKMKMNKKKEKTSNFTYLIDTDGFATSIHFRKTKKNPSLTEKQLNDIERNKLQTKNMRVIAIDPGRTNLIYGVEVIKEGEVNKYELKKSTYYQACGMNKEAAWKKRRMDEIMQEELIYREHSLKTTKIETYVKFISNYLKVYNVLWKTKTTKKWLGWKFRTYCLKNKFIDTMINKMVTSDPDVDIGKEKKKVVIAYGAAKFSPTGKGERAGPTSWLSKQFSKKIKTVFIDEFNTTKKCCDCGNTLHAVKDEITKEEKVRRKNIRLNKRKKTQFIVEEKKVDKDKAKDLKLVEIRGLRWCSTCRIYKNRDLNAAMNILEVFNHKRDNLNDLKSRPDYLSRSSKNKKTEDKRYSLIELQKTNAKNKKGAENFLTTYAINLV